MKVIDFFWEHPELKRFERQAAEGQYLFQQGQMGNTMFVVIRGYLELITQRNKKEYVIGFVEAGEFLGEKAILQDTPYRRAFAARCKTQSTILEMSLRAIESVKRSSPEILNDILRHNFQMAARRLDRTNFLTRSLRSSNNFERLIHLIIYFSRVHGRPSAHGPEFILLADTVSYYIDMLPNQITNCLSELAHKGLIRRLGEDFYSLPSERKLLESLPALKEQLQHGYYDELEIAP